MEKGLIEGEICNRDNCNGVMKMIEDGSCCSCHINPPCSHCVDAIFACSDCGHETEPPAKSITNIKPKTKPWMRSKTTQEVFDGLSGEKFDYVTIAGKYYWMEYKGKYPPGMTSKEVLESFNTCFGYKWIARPANGQFHLKVYTD